VEFFELNKCSIRAVLNVFVLTVMWWTIVITGSYELTLHNNEESMEKLAIAEARSYFEKDMLFRKWGAEQATTYYKLESEGYRPNPYLSHLPERDIITVDGKKLTVANPAMSHEVNMLGSNENRVKIRITSLKPLNPVNKADAWEEQALKKFEKGVKEVSSIEYINGIKYTRYMGPLFVEKSCLKCHSKNGYKIGDIRGGISVSVPYTEYDGILSSELFHVLSGHILVWIVGVLGIATAQLYLAKADCRQRVLLAEAEKLSFRNMLLGSLNEGVYGVGNDGKLLFINRAALDILGYAEEEVLGSSPHSLFHYKHPNGEDYPIEECPAEKSMREGVRHFGEDMLFGKNGNGIHVEINATPIMQNDEIVGSVVAFKDISQRLKMQQELETLARTDYLTGIGNRRTFMENLKQDFALFKRNSIGCSVLMLDIDHFKSINDTFGHAAGDAVLKELSHTLTSGIRNVDFVGRLGGEEFGIILRQTGSDGALDFAKRLQSKINASCVNFDNNIIMYTVSIGISSFMETDEIEESILSRADKALYIAKESGRNKSVIG